MLTSGAHSKTRARYSLQNNLQDTSIVCRKPLQSSALLQNRASNLQFFAASYSQKSEVVGPEGLEPPTKRL